MKHFGQGFATAFGTGFDLNTPYEAPSGIEVNPLQNGFELITDPGAVVIDIDGEGYVFHTVDVFEKAPVFLGDADVVRNGAIGHEGLAVGDTLQAYSAPYVFDPAGGDPAGTEAFVWCRGTVPIAEGPSHEVTEDDMVSGLDVAIQATNSFGTSERYCEVVPSIPYTEEALNFTGTQRFTAPTGWSSTGSGSDDVFTAISFIPLREQRSTIMDATGSALYVHVQLDGSIRVIVRNQANEKLFSQLVIWADDWGEGDRLTVMVYAHRDGTWKSAGYVNGQLVTGKNSTATVDGSAINTTQTSYVGASPWHKSPTVAQVFDLRIWENLSQKIDPTDPDFANRFIDETGATRAPEIAQVVLGWPSVCLPRDVTAANAGVNIGTGSNFTLEGTF